MSITIPGGRPLIRHCPSTLSKAYVMSTWTGDCCCVNRPSASRTAEASMPMLIDVSLSSLLGRTPESTSVMELGFHVSLATGVRNWRAMAKSFCGLDAASRNPRKMTAGAASATGPAGRNSMSAAAGPAISPPSFTPPERGIPEHPASATAATTTAATKPTARRLR